MKEKQITSLLTMVFVLFASTMLVEGQMPPQGLSSGKLL